MNRKDLVEKMSERSSLTKPACDKALSAFQQVVGAALADGESVTLVGFGTFKVSERSARQGRNPASGKPMAIPARRVPRFVVGKKLKEQIK